MVDHPETEGVDAPEFMLLLFNVQPEGEDEGMETGRSLVVSRVG